MRRLIWLGALVAAATACGGDCTVPPCPFPGFAIQLTVTANSGVAIAGLTVKVTGPDGSLPCQESASTSCVVAGNGGTYQLDISAPGFQSVQETVEVTSVGKYGCNSCLRVNTQNIALTLAPS
jgi:hypothetical protein